MWVGRTLSRRYMEAPVLLGLKLEKEVAVNGWQIMGSLSEPDAAVDLHVVRWTFCPRWFHPLTPFLSSRFSSVVTTGLPVLDAGDMVTNEAAMVFISYSSRGVRGPTVRCQ